MPNSSDALDFRRAHESVVLDALAAGHPLALAETYHRSVPAAHAVARRLMSNAEAVEQLLLDVYQQLWDSPPSSGPVEGWVRRATWAKGVETLRLGSTAPNSPSAAGLLPDLPAPNVRFLDAAERAIAELPDDERRALLLVHDKGVPTTAQESGTADALSRALINLAGPETSTGDRAALHEDGCGDLAGLGDWCLGVAGAREEAAVLTAIDSRPGCAAKARAVRRGRRRIEGLPATPDMGQRILVTVLTGAGTRQGLPTDTTQPEPTQPEPTQPEPILPDPTQVPDPSALLATAAATDDAVAPQDLAPQDLAPQDVQDVGAPAAEDPDADLVIVGAPSAGAGGFEDEADEDLLTDDDDLFDDEGALDAQDDLFARGDGEEDPFDLAATGPMPTLGQIRQYDDVQTAEGDRVLEEENLTVDEDPFALREDEDDLDTAGAEGAEGTAGLDGAGPDDNAFDSGDIAAAVASAGRTDSDWRPDPGSTAELRLSDILAEGEDEDPFAGLGDHDDDQPTPARSGPYAALSNLGEGPEPGPRSRRRVVLGDDELDAEERDAVDPSLHDRADDTGDLVGGYVEGEPTPGEARRQLALAAWLFPILGGTLLGIFLGIAFFGAPA